MDVPNTDATFPTPMVGLSLAYLRPRNHNRAHLLWVAVVRRPSSSSLHPCQAVVLRFPGVLLFNGWMPSSGAIPV